MAMHGKNYVKSKNKERDQLITDSLGAAQHHFQKLIHLHQILDEAVTASEREAAKKDIEICIDINAIRQDRLRHRLKQLNIQIRTHSSLPRTH